MANLKRANDPAQRSMLRWLLLFCVPALLILPLFSGIFLGDAYETVANDVQFQSYGLAIDVAKSVCETFCIFAGYAVLIFAFTSDIRGSRAVCAVLWLLSRVITLLCGLFIARTVWSHVGEEYWPAVLTHLSNFAGTVLVGILLMLWLFFRRKKDGTVSGPIDRLFSLRDPRLTAAWLTSAVMRLLSLGLTLTLLIVVGGASLADILFPVLEAIILFFFGYVLTAGLLALFARRQNKHIGEPRTSKEAK